MKILQLNAYGNYSTGKIAQGIAVECNKSGIESLFLYARNDCCCPTIKSFKIGNPLSIKWHFLMSRLFDRSGFHSSLATRKIIKKIKAFSPDIIHLHIIHGYYCNVTKLFRFLATYGKPVVWTFHDCWAYTGHCAYYLSANCNKWKNLCDHCSEKMTYPRSFFLNQSKRNYVQKKKAFTSLKNLTIVTNCNWLKREVCQSFLQNADIRVIHNGVDQNIFKYNPHARSKLFGDNKKTIVLTVANKWDIRKGLNDVIDVYNKLNHQEYLFVVIGLTPEDQRLFNYQLPKDFIVITRTSNQSELADYYSACDYFLCLSHEDTFPTTIIECISCGSPVLTYKVGGCGEAISDEVTGKTFAENDVQSIADYLSSLPTFDRDECVKLSRPYSSQKRFQEYIDLYNNLIKK